MKRYFGLAFSFLIEHLLYIHLEEFWSMAFVCRAYGIGNRTVNESWLVLGSFLEFVDILVMDMEKEGKIPAGSRIYGDDQ